MKPCQNLLRSDRVRIPSFSGKAHILIAFCFILTLRTNAQSNPVADASASMEEVNAQTNLFEGTFTVRLSDTTTVSQIEIKLGTYNDASDIVLRTFDFDITSGLPANCSYNRIANILTLVIGRFNDRSTYFASVRIKDTGNSWSSPFKFITN